MILMFSVLVDLVTHAYCWYEKVQFSTKLFVRNTTEE